MKREALKTLLEKHGQRYSEALEIKLETADDHELFKWFLAAVLLGAPITESSVIKTYRCFEKHHALTPEKILRTGWDGLVKILDEGSYTRYDFKTADKLLLVMGNLMKEYDGSLNLLHEKAVDSEDLENRLKHLGKGIGDTTVSMFLRDLRGIWEKADPKPTPLVILAAKNFGIIRTEQSQEALEELKALWNKNKITGYAFINFETALLRLGKEQRRKNRKQSMSS
jgi:hypothetical protein